MATEEMKRQTTLRQLLLAIAMVAAGLACLMTLHHNRIALFNRVLPVEIAIWFAGGPLVGAGLLLPFKRAQVGAVIGFVCQFLFTTALFLFATRQWR